MDAKETSNTKIEFVNSIMRQLNLETTLLFCPLYSKERELLNRFLVPKYHDWYDLDTGQTQDTKEKGKYCVFCKIST